MEKENYNMLEIIFEARERDLALIDEDDKKFMSQDKANRSKKSKLLNDELDKIPYNLNWLKASIKRVIKDYIETIDYESYYFYKKYYFAGLRDGINLKEELK